MIDKFVWVAELSPSTPESNEGWLSRAWFELLRPLSAVLLSGVVGLIASVTANALAAGRTRRFFNTLQKSTDISWDQENAEHAGEWLVAQFEVALLLITAPMIILASTGLSDATLGLSVACGLTVYAAVILVHIQNFESPTEFVTWNEISGEHFVLRGIGVKRLQDTHFRLTRVDLWAGSSILGQAIVLVAG